MLNDGLLASDSTHPATKLESHLAQPTLWLCLLWSDDVQKHLLELYGRQKLCSCPPSDRTVALVEDEEPDNILVLTTGTQSAQNLQSFFQRSGRRANVETAVKVAGATARHCIALHGKSNFLSGTSRGTDCDHECCIRADVVDYLQPFHPRCLSRFFPRVRTPCGRCAQVIVEGQETLHNDGKRTQTRPQPRPQKAPRKATQNPKRKPPPATHRKRQCFLCTEVRRVKIDSAKFLGEFATKDKMHLIMDAWEGQSNAAFCWWQGEIALATLVRGTEHFDYLRSTDSGQGRSCKA